VARARQLRVEIIGDAKGLNRSLGQAEGRLKGFGSVAGKVGGALAGAFALGAVVSSFKGFVAAARESQAIAKQTDAVIKSTGGAAHVSAKGFATLAAAISKKVAVDDDLIQAGENILATFTNVRNEAGRGNDIFNQATMAATDLAAAMNHGEVTADGLKGANIQLGKALNDPVKGITALTRVGVTFDEGQKKQIKTLVAHGDRLGAQKIILAELTKEFGGSAASQATASKRLGVAWGNIQEQLGGVLIPILDKVASWLAAKLPGAIETAKRVVGSFVEGLKRFWHNIEPVRDALGRLWETIKTAAGEIGGALVSAFKSFGPTAGDAKDQIGGFADFITTKVIPAVKGFTDWLVNKGIPNFLQFADTLVNNVWIPVGKAALEMAAVATRGLAILVRVAVDVAGAILAAMVRSFGWVPGLGDKLREAKANYDKFAGGAIDATDAAADAMNKAKETGGKALDALGKKVDGARGRYEDLQEQAKIPVVLRANIKDLTDKFTSGKIKATEFRTRANAEIAKVTSKPARDKMQKLIDDFARGKISAAQFRARFNAEIAKTKGKTITVTAKAVVTGKPEVIREGVRVGFITGRARGGSIRGPGSGTSDSIPAMLSDNEHVVTAREVAGAGGHAAVERQRAIWRGATGFAAGGGVNVRVVDATNRGAFAAGIRAPADAAQRISISLAKRLAVTAATAFVKAYKDSLGGGSTAGGRAAIKAFIRSTDSHPYRWGGVGPGGYDCSGLTGEVYARHRGRRSFRRYFTTASNFGGLGFKPGGGGTYAIGVLPGRHMAGEYGGLKFEARSTRSGIFVGGAARSIGSFPRRFHMAKGGAVLEALANSGGAKIDIGGDPGGMSIGIGRKLKFDRGGFLPTGWSMAYNGTGKPEPVGGVAIDYDRLGRAVAAAMRESGRPVVKLDRRIISEEVQYELTRQRR
jgi:hypothetical protein